MGGTFKQSASLSLIVVDLAIFFIEGFSKEIKISRIKDLTVKDLQDYGAKLGLLKKKKSGELLKIDLINLSNIFLGGQVDI